MGNAGPIARSAPIFSAAAVVGDTLAGPAALSDTVGSARALRQVAVIGHQATFLFAYSVSARAAPPIVTTACYDDVLTLH
jgi:hypothetical protein